MSLLPYGRSYGALCVVSDGLCYHMIAPNGALCVLVLDLLPYGRSYGALCVLVLDLLPYGRSYGAYKVP